MEPGKVFTRDELKRQFRFATDEGTDRFLDMLEAVAPTAAFKVVHLMGERLLVFETDYWDQFLDFMKTMGYTNDSEE